MKIIKQGKLEKKEKCSYCECEFEYDAADIKEDYEYTDTCIIYSTMRKFVKCPECGNKIKIRFQGEQQ